MGLGETKTYLLIGKNCTVERQKTKNNCLRKENQKVKLSLEGILLFKENYVKYCNN